MKASLMDIDYYKIVLAKFAEERDWDQFHSPKNLVMALAGEVGELLEIFQWLSEEQSMDVFKNENVLRKIKEEIADITIYLIRLSDKLNIDIVSAVDAKISINHSKYPVDLAKGNAIKYSDR